MVDKSAIGVRFLINIIYRVQSIFKALVHSYLVVLVLSSLVSCYRLIHLGLLVYSCQLVLPQRLPPALTLLLRPTHQWHSISLLVFLADGLVSSWMRNRLFACLHYAFVGSFLKTDGAFVSGLQRGA